MTDIIKEISKMLPDRIVSAARYEGANIVLYTKDKKFFLEHQDDIRKIVSTFKKRIELRPDPTLCMASEKAKKAIEKIIPKEAGLSKVLFDPCRSEVTVEVEKPGLAIGKQGSNLKDIREKTMWVARVQRTSALNSQIIDNIRSVLWEANDFRQKFLDKVGHRIYDGWIREKKNEWIRISYLGAGRQVGRSCILLQTQESRVLLDCGIDPGYGGEPYPFLEAPEFDINSLDAVVVTHAHLDHTGMIPYLFKFGYRGPVYCTLPTRDIMALLQLDFIKLMRNERKDEGLYGTDEVKEMVKHTICLDYYEVTDITPDVRLTFYNSGHIIGSAMAHLHIGNGLHNMMYTGDMKYGKTKLLAEADTSFPRLETLMLESTYGGKGNVLPPEKEQINNLKGIIKTTVERGGKILMPTLGVGRAQEVMVIVEEMIRTGALEKIPVYIDGMVWDITAIHTAYPEFLAPQLRKQIFHRDNNPFLSDIFTRVGSQKERMQIINHQGPCLLIATSGMLVGGPSVEYLKNLADNPRNSLIFSCYQGEGSLGRRILDGQKEVIFKHGNRQEIIPLKMEVHRIEITAHADRKELMSFVQHCQPRPRKVIVNHGESSRCLDLASSLHKQCRIETTAPKNLEAIRLK